MMDNHYDKLVHKYLTKQKLQPVFYESQVVGTGETLKMTWLPLLFQGGGAVPPKHHGFSFIGGQMQSLVWPCLET